MELDRVDPGPGGVMGLEDRRESVGDAAELEGLRRAPLLAELGQSSMTAIGMPSTRALRPGSLANRLRPVSGGD